MLLNNFKSALQAAEVYFLIFMFSLVTLAVYNTTNTFWGKIRTVWYVLFDSANEFGSSFVFYAFPAVCLFVCE